MLTIGTAGHIDHGKSSLVKALTSIDPDRLPEEKERGMTIDLGFAWLALPSGETVGIVDVPGHKQFVHNVIPGLFGIDAVLLVVAADDGWMPQTEEHVQILDLLGIKQGIVVLNKVDLATDSEWLDLVERDIAQHLDNTSLAQSPIIRVSTRTGAGLDELKHAIAQLAQKITPRQDIGKPRLPIDRVFSIKGSGVVVTGTMHQGAFALGDEVVISPSGLAGRIRSLESYKHEIGRASPGSRVAINLTGIKREELRRGDVVLKAGLPTPTSRLVDVELKLLPQVNAPLKNMAELQVYLETRELLGRVALLGTRSLKPGETTLAQLRFSGNVNTFIGERFILRQQSPAKTIGGGVVLDPLATKFKLAEIQQRQAFLAGRRSLKLEELIPSELEKNYTVEAKNLLAASQYSQNEIKDYVKLLLNQKKLVEAGLYLVGHDNWQDWSQKLLDMLVRAHEADKLRKGLPQAALQSALALPKEVFDGLVSALIAGGKLVREGDTLALPEHKPQLSPQQEALRSTILKLYAQNRSAPPTLKEVMEKLPGSLPVVRYMIQQGQLVELPDGILLETGYYHEIQDAAVRILTTNGHISIQDINSRFGFSRKYSIPLLTHMDRLGVTRREGDVRVAGKKMA